METLEESDIEEDNLSTANQIRKEVLDNNLDKRRTEEGLPPETPPDLSQDQVVRRFKELLNELSAKFSYITGFVLYGSFADAKKTPRKESDIDFFIILKDEDVDYVKSKILEDELEIFEAIKAKFADTGHFQLETLAENWIGANRLKEVFTWDEKQGEYIGLGGEGNQMPLGTVKIITG